ncbi:tagatose 1,6-diphosphate aldolase [Nitratireductor alexandrii]|uniref:tagatose 1,6-diphosphate aldolase n=1 Tax=Nitratireductor alexandrii TaxID=2448161 RepID=UPI000FD6DB8F|nr:tagatose 1,6-diphosphate aldolase [Nitratireductor alexandrii]
MTANGSFLKKPICGVAVDQGSGLEKALREARGPAAAPDDLFRFKRLVVEALSGQATTLLVDAVHGRELLPYFAPGCEKMLAFEADVYRISNEDRITVLPDNLSVSDYPGLGVRVLKFFLYFGPRDPAEINERKFALVADIGRQCSAAGVTFLFEPIVYDRAVPDGASSDFATLKPQLVTEATRIFADSRFEIDVLKVEVPVNLNFVEGFGEPAMSREDAEAAFRRAADAAGDIPIVYLSAGVTFEQFEGALGLARAAGVDMAGFMCGRAIWSDAIAVYGAEGPEAAEAWMRGPGRERLARLAAVVS